MIKKTLGLLLLASLFHPVFAQSNQTIEKDLVRSYQRIQHWAQLSEQIYAADSLLASNLAFENLLFHYSSKISSTIKQDFKELSAAGVRISTSEDGKFRIYSWDTRTGGSMHFFKNIFQYQIGNQVKAQKEQLAEADAGAFYYLINDVKSVNKQYYLTQSTSVLSSALSYHKVKLFSIDEGKLNPDVKLIKTKTGIRNQLGYEVDLSAKVNQELSDSNYKIKYDHKNKVISIPLIQSNGKLTTQRILYKFTGRYFEKK